MFDVREAHIKKQSENGGLPSLLESKINACVMLITNINNEVRLINGQMGLVKHTEKKKMKSELYIWKYMASVLDKSE